MSQLDDMRERFIIALNALATRPETTSDALDRLMRVIEVEMEGSGARQAASPEDSIAAAARRSRSPFDIARQNALESVVVSRAAGLIGDRARADAWYRYAPIPALGGKTARQLVVDGDEDAVILHLETLEDGVYA